MIMPHNNDDYLAEYCVCHSALLLQEVREALDTTYHVTTISYSQDHEDCFVEKVYPVPLKQLTNWLINNKEYLLKIEACDDHE